MTNAAAEKSLGSEFRAPLVIAASLIALSWLSLSLAYFSPWTTEAWVLRFDQLQNPDLPRGTGFAIEALRSLIYISIITFVTCLKFPVACRLLFNPREQSWLVNGFRIGFLILALFFSYGEISRHLDVDRAPAELAQLAHDKWDIDTDKNQEWYPYCFYLPYTLLNYVPVIGALIIIPGLGVSRGMADLVAKSKGICPDVDELTTRREADAVRQRFGVFRQACERRCTQYLDVMAAATVAMHFEYFIGRFTLTDKAYFMMQTAWGIVALGVGASVAAIWYYYGNRFTYVHELLVDAAVDENADWVSQNRPGPFLLFVLFNNVSGIIILTLIFPLAHSQGSIELALGAIALVVVAALILAHLRNNAPAKSRVASGTNKLFLSYRRSDSADICGRIYDRLESHFGAGTVFMDVDNIPIGVDFVSHLHQAVDDSSALLVVIGDKWLAADENSGKRRLDDPKDFVRIEIERALSRDIPVVPVLVGNAQMPSVDDLPSELERLAFRNAAEVRSGRDFGLHMDALTQNLKPLL